MNKEGGQSLIEVIVAMGIFVLWVSATALLILDIYASDKIAKEKTIALFLAREGIEATRSIRDNNWDDLILGEHGLALSGGYWILSGSSEDISEQLLGGTRRIIIEETDADRKKVVSEVNWEGSQGRPQSVALIAYFTNWQKIMGPQTCEDYCRSLGYTTGSCYRKPSLCSVHGGVYEAGGDGFCSGHGSEIVCCCE